MASGHMRWDRASPRTGRIESLKATNLEAVKMLPNMSLTLTRHFVIRPPFNAIANLAGKINQELWGRNIGKTGFAGFPPETVRFDGFSFGRKVTNQGVGYFDCVYKFSVQVIYERIYHELKGSEMAWVGWNRYYREETSLWEGASTVGDREPTFRADRVVSQTVGSHTETGFNLLFWPRST